MKQNVYLRTMYQARVAAVKHYYQEIIRSPKSDAFACTKLLAFQQYIRCKPDWFTEPAWESICKYWCSEYLKKRRLGQEPWNKNPDSVQNRGGSRPLVETQQYLGANYGSEQGNLRNAFCCTKSGVKNCDSNGNTGPIPKRAKQLADDYDAAIQEKYPDNWQEQPFDGKIAYDIGGGMSHGRLAIVNGAVKKTPIVDAAKAGEIRPSTSRSYPSLWRRYEEQVANNRHQTEQNVVLTQT